MVAVHLNLYFRLSGWQQGTSNMKSNDWFIEFCEPKHEIGGSSELTAVIQSVWKRGTKCVNWEREKEREEKRKFFFGGGGVIETKFASFDVPRQCPLVLLVEVRLVCRICSISKELGATAMGLNVVWHWEGYVRAKCWKVNIWRAAWEACSATWNLATNSAFALRPRNTENLDRDGRSQDLPGANSLLASSPASNTRALTLIPVCDLWMNGWYVLISPKMVSDVWGDAPVSPPPSPWWEYHVVHLWHELQQRGLPGFPSSRNGFHVLRLFCQSEERRGTLVGCCFQRAGKVGGKSCWKLLHWRHKVLHSSVFWHSALHFCSFSFRMFDFIPIPQGMCVPHSHCKQKLRSQSHETCTPPLTSELHELIVPMSVSLYFLHFRKEQEVKGSRA
jgi:hypothetical protein